jgi:phosphatidylglycerol:prolipoprotein diacylglycerol transferase
MMLTIAFPFAAPDAAIALQIGPLSIRWYALAYITGIMLGWWYMRALCRRPPQAMTVRDIDDFVVWATLGVVLGGRLGYVLFYKPGYYLHDPLSAFALWQGGMSFHGGLIGVIVAIVLFARQRKVSWFNVGDLVVCAVPIGLFFGRIANFVNGELFGRPSDVAWAMVFPHGGPSPRHPSQLYQAALEGLVLFAILFVLARYTRALERPGFLGGVFLAGYGIARIIGELFREPDAHLGFLVFGATMGQLLSIPVFLAGLYLMMRAKRPT